MVESKYS